MATSVTLQIYLAIGQLTSRLRRSSLPFLMHINTYFLIALPMCLTYPSSHMFHLDFFIIIFISFSSLFLQLQRLANIGYKSSSMTHTQPSMQLMLLAHSRICNPTFAPIYFFAFPLVILINSCQSQYSAITWFFLSRSSAYGSIKNHLFSLRCFYELLST